MDWFRWHHGSVTDPKFQLVARKAGASLPDVLAVWAFILEKASASEDRGCFECVDAEALDVLFAFPDGRTADVLASLETRGLTEAGRIVQWEKRQPKREREDNSTGRVQAYRERQRQEGARNATERQETPRGDKSREEEKKGERRATRIPPNFEPTPEPEAEQGIDRAKELANFRDYWTAKSGKDATKLDWQATWRTWARKAYRKPADTARTTVPGPTGRDPALVKLDEDAKKAAPIPPQIKAQIDAALKGKVH
jgi:hypothetical protein